MPLHTPNGSCENWRTEMAFGKDPNDMKKDASFNGGSMEQRAAYARKLAEEQASKAKASSKAGG